jgi:flagellar protein FlgJ
MTIDAVNSNIALQGLGARGSGLSALGRLPAPSPESPAPAGSDASSARERTREAFSDFVGQTFFTQLLTEMRKTVDKPAYFHGGQAEDIFQGQMDQLLAERLSEATADSFAGPMFELFMLRRD